MTYTLCVNSVSLGQGHGLVVSGNLFSFAINNLGLQIACTSMMK